MKHNRKTAKKRNVFLKISRKKRILEIVKEKILYDGLIFFITVMMNCLKNLIKTKLGV